MSEYRNNSNNATHERHVLKREKSTLLPTCWGRSFAAPLGSAASGRLVFTAGAAGISLLARPGLQHLAQGRFVRQVSWVGIEAGIVMIGFHPSAGQLYGQALAGDEISLSAALPWEIEFRGGAAGVRAQLDELQLRSLDVLGGCRQVFLQLSRPRGTAYIYLTGGASQVLIQRPAGVGVGMNIQGGISGLSLDGRFYDSPASETRLESAGYQQASCRYDISITGGANQIRIC